MQYKNDAIQTLVKLFNDIQKSPEKEKLLKTIVIEDRVSAIIENIIKEAEMRILLKIKNGAVNVQTSQSKKGTGLEI
jgi:hypothetical protein